MFPVSSARRERHSPLQTGSGDPPANCVVPHNHGHVRDAVLVAAHAAEVRLLQENIALVGALRRTASACQQPPLAVPEDLRALAPGSLGIPRGSPPVATPASSAVALLALPGAKPIIKARPAMIKRVTVFTAAPFRKEIYFCSDTVIAVTSRTSLYLT